MTASDTERMNSNSTLSLTWTWSRFRASLASSPRMAPTDLPMVTIRSVQSTSGHHLQSPSWHPRRGSRGSQPKWLPLDLLSAEADLNPQPKTNGSFAVVFHPNLVSFYQPADGTAEKLRQTLAYPIFGSLQCLSSQTALHFRMAPFVFQKSDQSFFKSTPDSQPHHRKRGLAGLFSVCPL